MKPKAIIKIIIDIIMTILLICLMSYQIVGDFLHEWFGTGIFILFIMHHVLNYKWYPALFKGKYNTSRIMTTVIDFLVLFAMLGLMVSSVIMSQYVFTFLNISGGMQFARTTHLLCSYWGFVLMSLHLGMHWGMIIGMVKKAMHLTKSSLYTEIILKIITFLISAYGIYSFITEQIYSYMFLQTQFVFFDYEESAVEVFARYISMMVMFAAISYYAVKLIRYKSAKKEVAVE